jgi:hypothetical protein
VTGAAGGLPTTGRDIALLTLWGIFLVGFGSVLISASWKRWRAAKAEAGLGVRVDRGPSVADAVHRLTPTLETDDAELRPVSTAAIPIAASTLVEERVEPAPLIAEAEPAAEPVQAFVQEASERTSDLVSRLQDEIRAWSKPQE